jgi:hypothetical protein
MNAATESSPQPNAQRSRRCAARKRDGSPCQAWAVRGSDPPRCSSHRGGAPSRETLSHTSSDAATIEPEVDISTIEGVFLDLARKQAHVSDYLETHVKEFGVENLVHIFQLHAQTASRLGRLLRDKRALSGDAADGIAGAIAQALDELSTELGADL